LIHAVRFSFDAIEDPAHFGRALFPGDFQGYRKPCQGRTELVGNIPKKPALVGKKMVQLQRHGVEGMPQAADFVVAFFHRERSPGGKISRSNPEGCLLELAYGFGEMPGEPVAENKGRSQEKHGSEKGGLALAFVQERPQPGKNHQGVGAFFRSVTPGHQGGAIIEENLSLFRQGSFYMGVRRKGRPGGFSRPSSFEEEIFPFLVKEKGHEAGVLAKNIVKKASGFSEALFLEKGYQIFSVGIQVEKQIFPSLILYHRAVDEIGGADDHEEDGSRREKKPEKYSGKKASGKKGKTPGAFHRSLSSFKT